jgi:hypothetical protein
MRARLSTMIVAVTIVAATAAPAHAAEPGWGGLSDGIKNTEAGYQYQMPEEIGYIRKEGLRKKKKKSPPKKN